MVSEELGASSLLHNDFFDAEVDLAFLFARDPNWNEAPAVVVAIERAARVQSNGLLPVWVGDIVASHIESHVVGAAASHVQHHLFDIPAWRNHEAEDVAGGSVGPERKLQLTVIPLEPGDDPASGQGFAARPPPLQLREHRRGK